jgi:hypothetical protein
MSAFDGKCHICGEVIEHSVNDYFYMRVKGKTYEFCQNCIEKSITRGNINTWLVLMKFT